MQTDRGLSITGYRCEGKMYLLSEFIKNEDAAVTVDWVVLTAAIVGLGLGVITMITGGALDQTGGIEASLNARSVGSPGG